MNQIEFNEMMRNRTKGLALEIIKLVGRVKKSLENEIICKQIMRSATSVAANFRAACRARSDNERYAKLCIVVEEADETYFWLDLWKESKLIDAQVIQPVQQEALEILKIMAVSRKNLRIKLGK